MSSSLERVFSRAASAARLVAGKESISAAIQPEKTLCLYEFEACPYCLKVREAFSALEIEYISFPCPRSGRRYRPWVREHGGKEQFPYLVDPNTKQEIYESTYIINYLFKTYSGSAKPSNRQSGSFATMCAYVTSAMYPRGLQRSGGESKLPNKMLQLIGADSSPETRIIRSRLCSAEIPYWVRYPTGDFKESAIPRLIDENRNADLDGCDSIVDYLEQHYGV